MNSNVRFDMATVYRLAAESARGHATVIRVLRGENVEDMSREAVFAAARRLGIDLGASHAPAVDPSPLRARAT